MSIISTLNYIVNHPLNQHRKAQALLGFLKWQIGTRLVPGSVVFEWVSGSRVIVRRGDTGITQNIYCGLHDFRDMAYVLHVISKEDLFIDIGANVGAYTLLACAARGARGYCFEPVPVTYARLVDNLVLNNLSTRVIALNIGLSSAEGELVFTGDQNCTNHVVANGERHETTMSVPVRTLDSILKDESPSFLKIDVEGFETPVLAGADETLANPSLHSVIMELNGHGLRYGFDEKKLVGRMLDYGFIPYSYEPFSRTLHSRNGGETSGGNALFIRDVERVQNILAHAPRTSIHSKEF